MPAADCTAAGILGAPVPAHASRGGMAVAGGSRLVAKGEVMHQLPSMLGGDVTTR
jgi:hypothetical protein